ncbi:MAG TPA: hypothetical protein VMJ10_24955 [Kofleriaceae bacterium]|nr:hypothetical protein [Kofleriaceae bacterium]
MTIYKLGLVSFAAGLSILAACSDNGTTPTASGVFPADGFAGRSLRVEISGDATKWKDGATVTFGDGITVNMVEVASPTDLFADITIDPAAMTGMRDVTVTSGGTFTLAQAFEIDAPIDVSTSGIVAQGSLPLLTFVNHDTANPFDQTQGTDQNGNTIYPNLQLTGPAGVTFEINSVTDFSVSALALIDVDAGAGGPITITTGPTGSQVTSNIDSFPIMARSATTLTSGTAATGTLAAPNDSQLFEITAAANPSEVDFAIPFPSDPNAQPVIFILDSSGHWSNIVSASVLATFFGDIPLQSVGLLDQTGGKYYAVLFDLGGDSGYNYSVTGHTAAFTNVAQAAAASTAAGQSVATAQPVLITPAAITSTETANIYKYTTGVVGNYVHAVTFGGDTATDTGIEIDDTTTTACDTALTDDGEGGSVIDFTVGGEDTVTGSGLTSTTFCVRVLKGSAYAAAHTAYQLSVWLEQPE